MNHKKPVEENAQPLSYALLSRKCTNPNIPSTDIRKYSIVPVKMDGEYVEKTYYPVAGNFRGNDILKTKEEMIMEFTLETGNTVDYEISYENDGFYSNETVKIRRIGEA